MKKIIIDGKLMQKKEDLHQSLKSQLSKYSYYGNNLDALWDVLSTYDKDLLIEVINTTDLYNNLNFYGLSLLTTLLQASFENKLIKLNIITF